MNLKFTKVLLLLAIISGLCYSKPTAAQKDMASNFNFLYITVDSLRNLDKDKYVFQHLLGSQKVLTLHGWEAEGVWGRKFDGLPVVELSVWKTSKIELANNYVGDLVLSRHDLKRIKKRLGDTTRYIVFEPVIIKGLFEYKIFITKDEIKPQTISALRDPVFTDIGLSLNPSPPKRFY